MYTHTKAIVLGVSKYGDNALMVNTYTEKFGRIAFAVKVSHSGKRARTSAYFTPLAILEIEMQHRTNQDVHYMKECKIFKPYCHIPFDAAKNSVSYFVAELLQKTLRISEENLSLFSYLEDSLCFLDATNESCANFHLIFMLGLSRYLGYAPNMDGFCENRYFDMQAGEFVLSVPLHQDVLTCEEGVLLQKLSKYSFLEMHQLKMTADERRNMLRCLLRYFQIHQPGMGDFKTISVLEMLFR